MESEEMYEEEGVIKPTYEKPHTTKKRYKCVKELQTCTEAHNYKVNCPYQQQKKFTSRSKVKKPNYGCAYVPKRNSQIYCTTAEFRRDQYE